MVRAKTFADITAMKMLQLAYNDLAWTERDHGILPGLNLTESQLVFLSVAQVIMRLLRCLIELSGNCVIVETIHCGYSFAITSNIIICLGLPTLI